MVLHRHLLFLCIVVFHMKCASGKAYRWFCDITSEPVDTLALDRSTGLLYIKNPRGSVGSGGNRTLQQSFLRVNQDSARVHKAISVTQRQQEENGDTSSTLHEFRARKCWCAVDRHIYPDNAYYCIEPYTHCAIPAWWLSNVDLTPGCVNQTRRQRFARGVWPVALVWFAALCTGVCCTRAGRHVYNYILSKIFPGWNEWLANRILRRDPRRANRLIRQHWQLRRHRAEQLFLERIAERRRGGPVGPLESDGENEPDDDAPVMELVLKTRIFKSEGETETKADDDDSEFDDDHACTICFSPIEDGERVGELACDHVFHAECLKRWLVRRNFCPLCQLPNAATPRCRRSVRSEGQAV